MTQKQEEHSEEDDKQELICFNENSLLSANSDETGEWGREMTLKSTKDVRGRPTSRRNEENK